MRQLFRDQIPQQLTKELEGVRFVKLTSGPFGGEIVSKGNDPRVVDAGGQKEWNDYEFAKASNPELQPPSCPGTLYRIDERTP